MADSPRIDELKRRVQTDPASVAFAALAEEYRRAGEFEDAIATCTLGLRRHPSYLSAHVTLGRALAAAGRLGDARAEFEYVLDLAPENLAAIRGLSQIHHDNDVGPDQDAAHVGRAADQPPPKATAVRRSNAKTEAIAKAEAARYVPSPALGGLEQFLDAIARARSGRVVLR